MMSFNTVEAGKLTGEIPRNVGGGGLGGLKPAKRDDVDCQKGQKAASENWKSAQEC